MCFSDSSLWSNLYITGTSRLSKINDDVETYTVDSNNWSPRSISFVTRDTFLAMDNKGKVYEYSSDSMTRIGTFATISNNQAITSVLCLGHLDLVAVGAQDGIYFFALEDGLGGGNLGVSSSDRSISIPNPNRFALGEFEDELLILTNTDSVDTITRKCIPGTSCSSGREGVLVSDPTKILGFLDVAVLKERGVILVTVCSTVEYTYSVRSCPLSGSGMDIDMDCSLFENKRPTSMENQFYVESYDWHYDWQATCVEVDISKKIVYILGSFAMWAVDFDGNYIFHLDTDDGPTGFAFRPHEAFQISKIQPPASTSKAGTVIELPLDVNDHRNISLSDNFDFLQVADKITVRAEGYIQTVQDGLVAKIDVAGDVEHSSTSMTAKLGINSAGVWTVYVSGESGGVQVEFMNSPFILTVEPEVTDASKTEVIHLTSDIVAGEKFVGRFKLFDAYQNPTNWLGDRLYAEPAGDLVKSDGVWEYSSTLTPTTSGIYSIEITLGSNKDHIYGSPFQYTVKADVPDVSKCVDSVKNMKKEFFSSGSTFTGAMELSATPRDQYNNLVLDAVGFEAHMRLISGGIPGEATIVALSAADQYKAEVPVAENSESVIEVGIKYNDEFLDGSPKIITIKPYQDNLPTILGGVAAGVLLVSVGLWRFLKMREKRKVNQIRNSFSAQKFALQMEVKNLHESLRKKKHSDKEIEIMKKAMEEQGKERSDELRQVLIPSSEVKVVSLLGQGAFGTVNLGTYKDQDVAIKQLISIDEESVQRFRFECFLMKELRHPNVVKLVGVCWDDMMLGCLLEYIDGGSLEDRLKKDWTQPMSDRMTWKGALLSLAKDAANGVRYLHHSRYYDENEETWKDCIIHRDLKPDNMLVTKDNVLKLTDFGEARAADLSMTMTAVGTPIYISPEVMRNDRYDLKADTYSFGVVLAAMVRADKTIVEFFFSQLQRKMKKRSRLGIGIGSLNRYLERGWRPPLPAEFYPKLKRLISRCWAEEPADRPDFDQIVEELSGPISLEVQLNPEPIFGSGLVIADEDGEDGLENMDKTERFSLSGTGIAQSLDGSVRLADMLQNERVKNEELTAENENLLREIDSLKAQVKEGGGTVVDVVYKKQPPTIVKLKEQPTIVKFGVEDQKVGMVTAGAAVGSAPEKKELFESAPNPFANIFHSTTATDMKSEEETKKAKELSETAPNPFANIFHSTTATEMKSEEETKKAKELSETAPNPFANIFHSTTATDMKAEEETKKAKELSETAPNPFANIFR
ncbi:hypothetical protein TrVE_jg2679 [Triparma verrucosa]|uniref:Protein kinase domain-containing protein n=1 Tax=Triparma verrucosa TaxID=1606542 RepID=A0A9W7BDI4_9STRA|nr:hypothetical protein TrVE_jg2679 [Triparma verrucosa]